MFKEQLIYMFPLVMIFSFIAIFQAYLMIKTTAKYYFKFLAIPALLLTGFLSFQFLDDQLGYAYPSELPKKFIFLGFNIIGDGIKINYIELWAQSEGGRSRLYRIPYSEGLATKLKNVKARHDEKLVDMVGEFKKSKKQDSEDWTDNFNFYDFDVAKERPKSEASPTTIKSN